VKFLIILFYTRCDPQLWGPFHQI